MAAPLPDGADGAGTGGAGATGPSGFSLAVEFMKYLTITDHSPTASYAGGLSIDRLQAQWEEIARVQESVTVKLLRGSEVDILADGALDYPDRILEQLDIVIASMHQRFRLDAAQMTRRLTRAMTIPSEPIGSIPRPTELIQAIARKGSDDPSLNPLYEEAIRDTVRRFEETGSPVITDGEQRKYHNFWTYSVDGLPNTHPEGFRIPFAAGHGPLPRGCEALPPRERLVSSRSRSRAEAAAW